MKNTKDQFDDLIDNVLEERADNLPASSIREETVKGPFFDKVYSSLIGRGMKLIEGPRGCGKTHMMRYA